MKRLLALLLMVGASAGGSPFTASARGDEEWVKISIVRLHLSYEDLRWIRKNYPKLEATRLIDDIYEIWVAEPNPLPIKFVAARLATPDETDRVWEEIEKKK